MSSDQFDELLHLMRQLVENTDVIKQSVLSRTPQKTRRKNDELVALAVVAMARLENPTFTAIADELGVSRGTISKNETIRRAMETMVRDRRPIDKESVEEFSYGVREQRR